VPKLIMLTSCVLGNVAGPLLLGQRPSASPASCGSYSRSPGASGDQMLWVLRHTSAGSLCNTQSARAAAVCTSSSKQQCSGHPAVLACHIAAGPSHDAVTGCAQVALVGVLGVHHLRRHHDAAGVHRRPALHHRPGALRSAEAAHPFRVLPVCSGACRALQRCSSRRAQPCLQGVADVRLSMQAQGYKFYA
jgi:hypothetical protein